MAPTTYGYIRVSSKDQNEVRQVDAMLEFGISQKRMYIDKQSGKDFDRPSYKKMLSKLRPGDVVVVKSIDRLGRNYDDKTRTKKGKIRYTKATGTKAS